MRTDLLADVRSAFNRWRGKKKYRRERVPDDLVQQAGVAIEVYGVSAVAKAARMQVSRLREKLKEANINRVPSYSRIELQTPAGPVAEAETPSGLRLKIFLVNPEMVGLLSALSGVGRVS